MTTTSPSFPPPTSEIAVLEEVAKRIRLEVIRMSSVAQTAHLGGALSCVDILVGLYWSRLKLTPATCHNPARDRLIFSKGHAISALYTTLAARGFFPLQRLEAYNEPGSGLPEQPSPGCAPGVEWATGSLGHGLGVGLGLAVAAARMPDSFATYVVMSDGECQEGSVWEAAMLAPRLKLGPLTAIVDFNGWQATGRSREIMQMEPLTEKWRSFGWHAIEVDGHNMDELVRALAESSSGAPRAVIARTVKGKGASFIEDDNNWHYRSPTKEEVERAAVELGLA